MVEQVVVATRLNKRQNDIVQEQVTSGVMEGDLAAILDHAARVELFDGLYDPCNIFCFLLPSGMTAVGRLTPKNTEYGANSNEYFFESLLMDWQTFYSYGANPRALLSAAINSCAFSRYTPGKQIFPFDLRGQEEEVLCSQDLKRAKRAVGELALTVLVQATLKNEQTLFVSNFSAVTLISCVYSLLPIQRRRLVSASSGLFFRDDCTTTLVGVVKKKNELLNCPKGVETSSILDLRDVAKNPEVFAIDDDWCKFVQRALKDEDERSFFLFYLRLIEELQKCVEDEQVDGFCVGTAEDGFEWLGGLQKDEEVFDEDFLDSVDNEEEWKEEDKFECEDNWQTNDVVIDSNPQDEFVAGDSFVSRRMRSGNPFLDDYRVFSQKNDEEMYALYLEKQTKGRKNVGCKGNFGLSEDGPISERQATSRKISLEEWLRKLQEGNEQFSLSDESNDWGDDSPFGLRLAPFVILSAEFPELNEKLRFLNVLMRKLAKSPSEVQFRDELERFWRELCETCEERVIERIREVCVENMHSELDERLEKASDAYIRKVLACAEVFCIIMKGRKEKPNS